MTGYEDLEQRAEETFDKVMQQPLADRISFARECCGDDEPLLARVLQLLEHAPDSFTDDDDRFGEFEFDSNSLVGTTLDRFTVEKLLGEGGFGAVYLAKQHEPIPRTVAIKVVKRRMDAARVLARFDRERVALGAIEHPGTARLIDGGLLSAGHPFFVMEYVDGLSITKYCLKYDLSVKERVQLVLQLCSAIQHVHAKGIVHRDIKPSNVLVCEQEDGPHVKIIDFGIAAATTSGNSTSVVGTPAYMSPEQATEEKESADIRSDMYSIGVLLYELLTGEPPIPHDKLTSSSRSELGKILQEYEPVSPSTVCMHGGVCDSSKVRGDLDWIVGKCLEKLPEHRYQTVDALDDDLQRHIDGRPVLAAPPSVIYTTKKWIARNPAVFSTVSLLVVAIIVSVIFTIQFALEAKQKQADAEATTAFLGDMIRTVDPRYARDLDKTLMIRMLDDAAANASEGFVGRPASEGWVRDGLARTYNALGLTEKAEEQARLALALLLPVHGEIHKKTLETIGLLGAVLAAQGKYEEGLALNKQSYEGLRELLGPSHWLTLQEMANYASGLSRLQRLDEAEHIMIETLNLKHESLGKDDLSTLISARSLAVLYSRRGDFEKAFELNESTLDTLRETQGNTHPETLMLLNNIASNLHNLQRYEEALPYYRECLKARKLVLGDAHYLTVTTNYNIGLLLRAEEKQEEAIAFFQEALTYSAETYDVQHPLVLSTLKNLIELFISSQKFEEAEPLAIKLLTQQIDKNGELHEDTLYAKSLHAEVARGLSR